MAMKTKLTLSLGVSFASRKADVRIEIAPSQRTPKGPMKTFLALIVLLAALAIAQSPPTALTPPANPQPVSFKDDDVVATVDGKNVTVAEVRKMMVGAPPPLIDQFRSSPQVAISNVMLLRYLAGEAERLKLDLQSPYKEQIEIMRMEIMGKIAFNYLSQSFPVSPEEISGYYSTNKSKYEKAKTQAIYIAFRSDVLPEARGTSPEAVREAAEAAVRQANQNVKRNETEAKQIAESVVKEIRAGADFEAMVEKHCDDPSLKQNKGDFAVLKHGDSYPEELKKAVMALSPGSVADPVRQPGGFYILRLVEKSTQPQSEVTESIVRELRNQKFSKWFTDLQKRFQTKVEKPEFFTRPMSK